MGAGKVKKLASVGEKSRGNPRLPWPEGLSKEAGYVHVDELCFQSVEGEAREVVEQGLGTWSADKARRQCELSTGVRPPELKARSSR